MQIHQRHTDASGSGFLSHSYANLSIKMCNDTDDNTLNKTGSHEPNSDIDNGMNNATFYEAEGTQKVSKCIFTEYLLKGSKIQSTE